MTNREITIKIKTNMDLMKIEYFLFEIERQTQIKLNTIPRNTIEVLKE